MPESRRLLAAIMFTNIQGYTALMQEDEEQAINIRTEHRKILRKDVLYPILGLF